MTDTFALSIALFSVGLFILNAFRRDAKMLSDRHKRREDAYAEVIGLLMQRAERLPALINEMRYFDDLSAHAEEIRLRLQRREQTIARGETLIPLEQEISLLLAEADWEAETMQESAAENPLRLNDLLIEMQEREQAVAAARERYNDTAEAWNACQRAFPLGLLARAIAARPAPLFTRHLPARFRVHQNRTKRAN